MIFGKIFKKNLTHIELKVFIQINQFQNLNLIFLKILKKIIKIYIKSVINIFKCLIINKLLQQQ